MAAVAGVQAPAAAQAFREPPQSFFTDVETVTVIPGLYLMQGGRWRSLDSFSTSTGPPRAEPGGLLPLGLPPDVYRRAAAVAARALQRDARGAAAPARGGPAVEVLGDRLSPRSEEERRRHLDVQVSLFVRDATEDFPAPAPRGLRVMAVVDQVAYRRSGHNPDFWVMRPDLVVETTTEAAAQERVLQRLDAVVTWALNRNFLGPSR